MVIGTSLGWGDFETIALAVVLAFFFGYPLALASDTISIAVMEIVDNAIMLLIPGAMEAGLDDFRFWGSLAVALLIAGAVPFPVNRWLIVRGRGHAVVHEPTTGTARS